jgi:hypothetical protein
MYIFDHSLALRSYQETNHLKPDEISNIVITTFDSIHTNQIEKSIQGYFNIPLTRITKILLSINARLYWSRKTSRSPSLRRRTWKHKDFHFPGVFEKFCMTPVMKPLGTILVLLVFVFQRNLYKQLETHARRGGSRIVYVSVGGPTSLNDFLCIAARRLGLELNVILENWDNISSKAVFNHFPDKVGVWGMQSLLLAKRIHNLPPERVFLVGNPRVEWLKVNIKATIEKKHIFFAGGSSNFEEEINYLTLLSNLINDSLLDWEIRYLPHPKLYLRAKDELANLEILGIRILNKEVILQMNEIDNFLRLPTLHLYKECYEGAALTVSPLSTMNLEAGVLQIPTIGLDSTLHDMKDKNIPYVTEVQDHLIDICERKIMHIINNQEDFLETFKPLLDGEVHLNKYLISEADIEYLYYKASELLVNRD